MEFVSIRIITDDVERMAAFYGTLTGRQVARPHPLFAELRGAHGTLAIASSQTVPAMGDGIARAADNRSVIVEFEVDDVDDAFGRLPSDVEVAMAPRTMPWGNRSALVRDPDGTLVNLFARPATEQ